MANQPNPFVNPNQRGVELPEGCKDLIEVLERAGSQQRNLGKVSAERGWLSDVPRYVERLYMEPAGFILGIVVLDTGGILWVPHLVDGFRLSFLVRKQHKMLEQMSKDLFGETAFQSAGKKGSRTVSVALPEMWLEAAHIIDTVLLGYGAVETTRLIFDLRRVR